MTLRFSGRPGRRERQLRLRHDNPLFADPAPRIGRAELERARREDHEETRRFQEGFIALIQEAGSLKPNEESEVILKLKERVDQAYEQASGLEGDQSSIKAAIPRLIAAIMGAVRCGAGDDPMALQELAGEESARTLHYRLLEHSLVADLLAPESPITAGELLPTLLSSEAEALEAALQLFDPQQLGALVEDGRALLGGLERGGRLPPRAGPGKARDKGWPPFQGNANKDQRARSDLPINHSSTARAHCRPSLIAQTTSDWPRRMSPAANTPSTLVR